MNRNSEIILGIDPGTVVLGYGLIGIKDRKVELIEMGVLKLSAYKDPHTRLLLIHQKIGELTRQFKPHRFAIEAPFFGKNVQSMLKLGRAQGVAIAAAIQAGLEVEEYAPKKIKQSITGNGNANKEQVWKMLQQVLKFEDRPEFLDATDAVAVALCHYYQTRQQVPGRKDARNWEQFIQKHADRVIKK